MCGLQNNLRVIEKSITAYLLEENILDQVGYEEENCTLIQVGDTLYTDYVNTTAVPDEQFGLLYDKQKEDNPFSEVDKPCGWSRHSFLKPFTPPQTDNNKKAIIYQLSVLQFKTIRMGSTS